MTELYFSVDIESDGPIPGPNSMLSFGAAAFLAKDNGKHISTFQANLELLEGAKADPLTDAWWHHEEQAAAWAACRVNLQSPDIAIRDFISWVKQESLKCDAVPVFVAYPVGFDFMFMYWYMMHFAGESPFLFKALDIGTYTMALLKKSYHESNRKNMPKRWFGEVKNNHIALDDAMAQGYLFIQMLNERIKYNGF
jgi:hypothetical protein